MKNTSQKLCFREWKSVLPDALSKIAHWVIINLPFYWAACAPSHKMGFRSSAAKNGLPGEERHEGLVPRNDVLTNGFIWVSLGRSLARILFVPRLRSPWKTHKALRTWRRYLRCSKRFDHGSHSIIFLLFEFKSVRWCWRWETQKNARVAFKPTRRSW